MNTKKDFYFHILPNKIKKTEAIYENLTDLTDVYILCKNSFPINTKFDVNKLINNLYSKNEIAAVKQIKTIFSFQQINELSKNNIDFYVVDKVRLNKLGFNPNQGSNIYYLERQGKKMLY